MRHPSGKHFCFSPEKTETWPGKRDKSVQTRRRALGPSKTHQTPRWEGPRSRLPTTTTAHGSSSSTSAPASPDTTDNPTDTANFCTRSNTGIVLPNAHTKRARSHARGVRASAYPPTRSATIGVPTNADTRAERGRAQRLLRGASPDYTADAAVSVVAGYAVTTYTTANTVRKTSWQREEDICIVFFVHNFLVYIYKLYIYFFLSRKINIFYLPYTKFLF